MWMALALLAVGCSDDSTGPGNAETFLVRVENVSADLPFHSSGAFDTPVGAGAPGVIGPGAAYEFQFSAAPGMYLSFATMFVPSNDLFYAPDESGIALYDGAGMAVSGDVTSQISLWDAGTEVNEEPGVGANQPQRQTGPNTGTDEGGVVQLVSATGDGFTYPAVTDVIQVTITPGANNTFTVRIENVSTSTTLMPSDGNDQAVPLSPGVWVVHTDPMPFFESGMADDGMGLEALAEDGAASGLAGALDGMTGLTSPLAPGVWAVHTADDPFFADGSADRGDGLEALAEDGDPSPLAGAIATMTGIRSSGVFNTPVGSTGPGPLLPGSMYEFTVEARPGQQLSLVTMLVKSNDLFYGPDGMGIDLFGAGGTPTSGDVTAQIMLWDAGTETNEEPGIGPNQPIYQSGPDTGADESGVVQTIQMASDGFTYPTVSQVIRVTIIPQQ
jgi:hypothetical protein